MLSSVAGDGGRISRRGSDSRAAGEVRMTFYVRAARRRATLRRERGASPLLSVRRYISLAFEFAPFGMYPTGVDRLGEACEACSRKLRKCVGFGQLLAGERTAVCTNAPPRRSRIEERIALRHRSTTLGQPRAMAPPLL